MYRSEDELYGDLLLAYSGKGLSSESLEMEESHHRDVVAIQCVKHSYGKSYASIWGKLYASIVYEKLSIKDISRASVRMLFIPINRGILNRHTSNGIFYYEALVVAGDEALSKLLKIILNGEMLNFIENPEPIY